MVVKWFGPHLCSLISASARFVSLSQEYAADHQALLQSSRQMVVQQRLAEMATEDHCMSTCDHSVGASCFDARCFQNPKIWGPPTWFFLHSVALSQEEHIPKEQQVRLARFISEDLSWLLPCPTSGKRFRIHLANNSQVSKALSKGRQAFAQWLVTMHNIVNRELQKPELTFEEAMKYYTTVFDTTHAPCFGKDGGWTILGLVRDLFGTEKPCVDAGCFRTSTVWGPASWFFLHSMTLALPNKVPVERQYHILRFLNDLSWLLPCPSCGESLRRRLPSMPSVEEAVRQGREALANWLVALHNSVNKDLNKTQVPPEQAMKFYADTFHVGTAPCLRQTS